MGVYICRLTSLENTEAVCVVLEVKHEGRRLVGGCFFFQAEDGIRDLVRSRGLGDVYKRQAERSARTFAAMPGGTLSSLPSSSVPMTTEATIAPVSYTHLTLPTSDLV